MNGQQQLCWGGMGQCQQGPRLVARQAAGRPFATNTPPARRLRSTGSEDVATVAIAGGGVAGLAAAVALNKLGVDVTVLERAPSLRQEGSALALWSNAWVALDALGVGQSLRSDYLLLDRIELVSSKGKLLRGFRFADCDVAAPSVGGVNEMRGVLRAQLLQALADQLPPGTIQFSSGVQAVAEDGGASSSQQGQTVLQLSEGRRLRCQVCIGADGASSVVAQHLGMPQTNYAGYTAYRGLAQYAQGELPLPANTIRQMFGCGVRAGMYPLTQSDVYWYICFNADEAAPRPPDAAGRAAEALATVRGWSWGIEQAVRNTCMDAISRSLIRDRWTTGSFGRGCVTLVGDAAHPMTPNLGQGGCTAIEDAVVLARELAPALKEASQGSSSSSLGDVEARLRRYEAERARRCFPLTLRSHLFGAALQLPFEPICAVRDAFVERAFNPSHFLDHTAYDCGSLQATAHM